MKQVFTFFLLFSISASVLAQPTIDQSNFIMPGDVFNYSQITPGTESIDVLPEGGEDLTWDFSTLNPNGVQSTDTYFPLDSTPELFALFFGNEFIAGQNFSTHALELSVLDVELPLPLQIEEAYQFFRSDAEGYFITGNAAEVESLPLISTYDTLDRVFTFPLTYGDIDTNSFYFFTDVPSIGSIGQSGVRSTLADAWGELDLPNASYDCLRVRTELDVTDTVYIGLLETGELIERPRQVIYTWLSPEAGGIVAEAIFIADVLTSFRFLDGQSVLSLGEANENAFKIYPNPASINFEIQVPDAFSGEYKVLDLTGRSVLEGELDSATIVSTTMLPEGVYLVSVYNSREIFTKRLVVSR